MVKVSKDNLSHLTAKLLPDIYKYRLNSRGYLWDRTLFRYGLGEKDQSQLRAEIKHYLKRIIAAHHGKDIKFSAEELSCASHIISNMLWQSKNTLTRYLGFYPKIYDFLSLGIILAAAVTILLGFVQGASLIVTTSLAGFLLAPLLYRIGAFSSQFLLQRWGYTTLNLIADSLNSKKPVLDELLADSFYNEVVIIEDLAAKELEQTQQIPESDHPAANQPETNSSEETSQAETQHPTPQAEYQSQLLFCGGNVISTNNFLLIIQALIADAANEYDPTKQNRLNNSIWQNKLFTKLSPSEQALVKSATIAT